MKRKSPLDVFFALGDKVTKGDPVRKASFDYYLMWIIFFAFFLIVGSNFKAYLDTGRLSFLGWSVVLLCICWFQYSALKMAYEARKLMTTIKVPEDNSDIEEIHEMLKKTKLEVK